MNDFAIQSTDTIVAQATPNVSANSVESSAASHQPSTQIADVVTASPTELLETQIQQHTGDVVKSKQEERRDLFTLVDIIRCLVESRCAAVINKELGTTIKGTLDVRFDNPDEVTPKTMNTFLSKGVVILFPYDINQYPWLKKYCKQDGGINLSALCTRKSRPANINEAEWVSLMSMWAVVSTVLHAKGIDPIYTVFTEVLRSFGQGGPKINRKLGGGLASMQGPQTPMYDVLKKLISLLEKIAK